MAKGRKKIPDEMKILRGTDQPVRMNDHKPEITFLSKLPPPPKNFSSKGKKLYKNVGDEFMTKKLLNKVNIYFFVAWCREMSIYFDAEDLIPDIRSRMKDDLNINDEILNTKKIHKISKEALMNALKIGVEFGMTPSSQSKIIAPFVNKLDDFENYLNSK